MPRKKKKNISLIISIVLPLISLKGLTVTRYAILNNKRLNALHFILFYEFEFEFD